MDEGVDEAYVGPNSLNVAIITPFLTPIAGGSATSTFILARSLQARGHGVTIFTSDFGRKESRFEDEDNLAIVQSRCSANISGFLYTPEMKKQLKNNVGAMDIFDLASFRTYQNVVATRLARQCSMPYVLRAQGSLPRLGKSISKRIFDMAYGNRILRNSSSLVAVTQAETNQYERFGAMPSRISVIPNGVELAKFSNLPTPGEFASKFNMSQKMKIILFLGRIHYIKGIDTLMKSFSLLIGNGSNADCLLVVAGPDDGYLGDAQRLARRLNIKDRVLFCGPLNFRDKLAAFVDSSALVLPSYYEIFGNVILESYACSKPVIASRVQSMQDLVIDGKTGILFSPGNVMELANAISRMINEVENARMMGRCGRELVEREYDQTKLILKTEVIYQELTSNA
jgi:glycosyltransferase involved in cell wall biosynthesis